METRERVGYIGEGENLRMLWYKYRKNFVDGIKGDSIPIHVSKE